MKLILAISLLFLASCNSSPWYHQEECWISGGYLIDKYDGVIDTIAKVTSQDKAITELCGDIH